MVQSKKTPGPALAVVLVLVGCADPAPPPAKVVEPPPKPSATVTETATATAEPEPVGDGSEAAPFRLKAGVAQALPIEVKVRPYSGFVLENAGDLVISWGGEKISVVGPGGVSTGCWRSPCVVPVAQKGAYRVALQAGAPGTKVTVSARLLAPPKATAVKPGRSFVLKPKPIAADDPRGALADAVVHFDAPGHQVIDVRPLGGKRTSQTEELLKRVNLAVYGAFEQPTTTITASPDVGGALRMGFDVTAGDYVIRAVKDSDDRADSVEVSLRKPELSLSSAKSVGSPVPARAAALPKLEVGAKVDMEVTPDPEPLLTWVNIPEGADLAFVWTSSGAAVTMGARRATEGRLCDGSPCLFDRPKPGPIALYAHPGDDPVTVTAEARALPWPSPLATLSPGQSAEVTTTAASADDPRGAMGEIALDLEAGVGLDFEVQIVDFPVTKDVFVAAKDRVTIGFFGPDGKEVPGSGPDIQSTANLLAGRYKGTLMPSATGRHLLRIDGTGRPAGRKIKVSLDRWRSPASHGGER